MTQPLDRPPPPQEPKFLDQVRTALLIRSVTPELTEAYLGWLRAYIHFHALRHPETLGESEIGAYLTHLAVERRLPVAQQAQARRALLFLYREFLHRELGPIPVAYLPGPEVSETMEREENRTQLDSGNHYSRIELRPLPRVTGPGHHTASFKARFEGG